MSTISKIVFNNETKFQDIQIDLECSEVYIDKSSIGKDDNEKSNHNFLAVGRKNQEAKKLIALLANNGFFLTHHKNGISLFKRFDGVDSFKSNFDRSIQNWNDILYTLETPNQLVGECKLLVVFSSVADFPFNASIGRRMFFNNLPDIQKHIPQNTYVLRIVDLGAVLGSFYLPSKFDPNFDKKVQGLIEKIALENAISHSNIVLYGSSKGGTGALYHGLQLGYKALVVDPIVSDEFYLQFRNDQHFVMDVFPESKDVLFDRMMLSHNKNSLENIHLITSSHSEQFEVIYNNILLKNDSIKNYIFSNPNIKTHLDMEVQAFSFITTMLNNLIYGFILDKNLKGLY